MWWAGCLLLVLGVCSNAEHGVFKAKPGAQFEHMSVDRTTGQIYVGAVNQLYQLDQDLNILNLVQSEEMGSSWMNNHNKALLINYINLTLITCGSLTGNTTKNFRPGIATRSLEPDRMFRILFNNNQLGTRMFVNFNNQALFIINYVYGFASQGFSYFLTTQRKTYWVSSPYISKLVRICHNDSKYYSYTEIPITCHSKDGKQYNLVQTGFVGKPGSNLAKTLTVSTEDDVLFAVFSTSSESNRPGNNSALCVYSLASIRHTFTDNIRACYSGLGNQGLDFLYGVKACEKITTTIDDDFCGQSYNYPIGGEQSVEAYTAIQFNVRATAVTATSTGNDTVVFIGTQNGHLKKIIQENISHAFEYADVKIDPGVAVNADIHLEPNGTYLYVLTEQRLSKVKVQECHLFKTCWECLTRKDPYCGGWCTLENKCSPRSDCKDPDSWISYQSWTNPTIDGMVPSSREILVAFNTRKQLSVKLRNIFQQCIANIGFYCQFTIDRKKWNVKATLLGEMINCESTHFYHTLRLSNINASIAVIWGRSKTSLNNPDNVHVNIYSCQDLAKKPSASCEHTTTPWSVWSGRRPRPVRG
uniref:Plexin-A2 n=1 Tax=Cacopsylla melanoneura TaxID=428564 RepID=A0A8D8QCC4_9HEMI